MKGYFVVGLLLVLGVSAKCLIKSSGPVKQFPDADRFNKPISSLPASWNWADVNGTNYLTIPRNQHIPEYCGSCWAFGSTSALSDRFKIMFNATWPDINIAPQVAVSCVKDGCFGCNGGDAIKVYEYIHKNGITDETCQIYQARGWTNGLDCGKLSICETCDPNGNCYVPKGYHLYNVTQYGIVKGEQQMINALQEGPIACDMDATPEFDQYNGGIFNQTLPAGSETNHVISIVGYGEEEGVKYWYGRNSWGTYWGEKGGFFKIVRGENTNLIESNCAWVTPDSTIKRIDSSTRTSTFRAPKHKSCRTEKVTFEGGERITGPRSWELLEGVQMPRSWDWRNISGVNYLSWNKNQHIPHYCGSCWAQGTTSAFADRIKIMTQNRFPTLGIAPQVVINCRAGGTCEGGNPGGVWQFANTHGIPDETCQQYLAKDPENFECSPIQVCENCVPPPAPPSGHSNCSAVQRPHLYYVGDYGYVAGPDHMKKEIYKHGPIGCGMMVTKEFEEYTGGIYSQWTLFPQINHEVSIVGWGVSETGEEYWIVRNSWGTAWGEEGFFRIRMYRDNLGIETDCDYGIPDLARSGIA